MHLQNRVTPFGDIIRTSARGTMMGNRGGVIHRNREIVRPYKSRRWIACVLQFKDRHRVVMTENRYTELFFRDEATAFAAGHRPCAECRRERFNAFRDAWQRWKGHVNRPMADEMDVDLHSARIDSLKNKVTYQAELGSLPDGCFVQLDGHPHLVSKDGLLLWTPENYTKRDAPSRNAVVTVLTPAPIVECFRHGYRPEVFAPPNQVV
jgi:hypothetical protein